MDTKELPETKEEKDRKKMLSSMAGMFVKSDADEIAAEKTRIWNKYYGKSIKRGRGYTKSAKKRAKRKLLMEKQSRRINRNPRRKTKRMRV